MEKRTRGTVFIVVGFTVKKIKIKSLGLTRMWVDKILIGYIGDSGD